MELIIDSIQFSILGIRDYIMEVIARHDVWTAFFFFFPIVIFVEAPRYIIPTLILPLVEWLGLWRSNDRAMQEFMKTNPSVSIIVAGRNEGKIIRNTIESLLALNYANKEIIVIDDHSEDEMYDICMEYAERGLIRFFRNNSPSGRAGRPICSNMGLRVSTGDFIISVDADTSYDYDIIERMIGPFFNPKVGCVAGNLKVRNLGQSIWTDCQAIEYALSIGLWKRWTSITHTTLQASGAFGAFRREALVRYFGWDPELAEDADLSLKARKCGWDIAFAPYAIAMTTVPDTFIGLVRQRVRWDKGTVRTYFHKHRDMFDFRRFSPRFCAEIFFEWLMIYLLSFLYVFYIVFMIFFDIKMLALVLSVSYVLYVSISLVTTFTAIMLSERRQDEWFLLWYVPFFPLYKEIFRWVRIYANFLETFRLKYREAYLPESGYNETEKW